MLTVDLSAIRSNVALLRAAAPNSQFMAVVKDNAYGHGLVPVTKAVAEAGADWLGIVHLSEGVTLRQAGIDLPILMLGYVTPDDVSTAITHRIDVPIMNLDHARELQAAVPLGKQLRVHLKVETGLHRFGVRDHELLKVARLVGIGRSSGLSSPLVPVGVYSHLAAVEEAELTYTERQIETFREQSQQLGDGLIRHLGATAATLLLPASHFDLVRCGIGIYGLWPSTEVRDDANGHGLNFRPALEWTEPIRALKTVGAGDAVGYGCAWRPRRESRVALLDVGYADGLPRALGNRGVVTIYGQPCPIVGRICSNVTFIDVTDLGQASAGDDVTLLAADDQSSASLDRQAERAGTIHYELAIRLPAHVARTYVS